MTKFTLEFVTDPVYYNVEETHIQCQVKWKEISEVLPFSSTAWDPEPHGQLLYAALKSGTYGPIAPFVFDPVRASLEIRSLRDYLIAQTDWTQASDVPSATKEKWVAYRQALRDITLQSTFPTTVIWPTEPA
jgi:predicted nicotinamide N-methyase